MYAASSPRPGGYSDRRAWVTSTRQRVTEHGAGEDANNGHHRAFGDHPGEQIPRLGAESQTDPELAGAPTHRKHQHAGNPDHRNRQSNCREPTEYQRVQTIRSEHFRSDVFQRGGMLDRLVHRKIADDVSDRRHQGVRVGVGVNEQTTSPISCSKG